MRSANRLSPESQISGQPAAALRAWIFNGLWRGALVGSATPIIGFLILASLPAEQLPQGTTTSSSLDAASISEVVSYVAALGLYATLAAFIGSLIGSVAGSSVGLLAGAIDLATLRRIPPWLVALATISVCATLTTWSALGLDTDVRREVRAVAVVPFALGAVSVLILPLRRDSADESTQQQIGERTAADEL